MPHSDSSQRNAGGGTLGGAGPTPESISGVERSEPNAEDYLSPEDVAAMKEGQFVTRAQISVQALLALRATLVAALQQVETALLLNGVVLRESSPRGAVAKEPDGDAKTHKLFGGGSVKVPREEV